MSNFTDVDALAAEPGVARRASPARRPTSSAPTSSCCPARRRRSRTSSACAPTGLDRALRRARRGARSSASAAATRCSATRIEDEVESADGDVDGLGLLPVRHDASRPRSCCASVSRPRLARRRPPPATRSATAASRRGGEPLIDDGGEPEGCVTERCSAPRWHGAARRRRRSAARCSAGSPSAAAATGARARAPFADVREAPPRPARRPGRASTSTPTALTDLDRARRARRRCPTITARRHAPCSVCPDDRRHRDPRRRARGRASSPDGLPRGPLREPGGARHGAVDAFLAAPRVRRRAACSAAAAPGPRASTQLRASAASATASPLLAARRRGRARRRAGRALARAGRRRRAGVRVPAPRRRRQHRASCCASSPTRSLLDGLRLRGARELARPRRLRAGRRGPRRRCRDARRPPARRRRLLPLATARPATPRSSTRSRPRSRPPAASALCVWAYSLRGRRGRGAEAARRRESTR